MKKIIRKWLGIDEDVEFLTFEINRLTVPKFKVGDICKIYRFHGVFLQQKEKVGNGKIVSVVKFKDSKGIKKFKYHLIHKETLYEDVSEYRLELKN
jgi:hypothetical protein